MEPIKLIVQDLEEELRVDKYIPAHYNEVSRSELKYYFDEQKIKVNGKIVKPSFKVINGDEILIEKREIVSSNVEKQEIKLDILYEDDDLIVVNKPSGMVVHPAPGHYKDTLVNALMYHCQELSTLGGESRSGIVHRLDKDTSGLLVACKNNKAHRILASEFKEKKETARIYYAIVVGNIAHNKGLINAPIGRDPNDRKKQAIVEGGKEAITHFEVLERFKNHTLIKCRLETGRTHQIRVHMAYINHPVLNDPLYGIRKQTTPYGQYLHAKTLGFVHPTTNEYMEFTSELPIEFSEKLEELRKEK